MEFGWHNPWPLEWGGGPTIVEKNYLAMKRAAGIGGSSDDEDSLEDIWRQRKAIIMGAFDSLAERAMLQFFPDRAQDALPYYEELLGLVASIGESDVERREESAAAYTIDALADTTRIETKLRDIDERFSIIEQTHESAGTTLLGRAFEPFDGSPDFDSGDATNKSTNFPNFSDDFVMTVLFSGPLTPGPTELEIINRARRFLNQVLSAWVAFRIVTSTGFILDQSPLDITGFGS